MADISAVFISIDLYSSTLDKLIKKTDEAVDKLIAISKATKKATADMSSASTVAYQAADKLQKSTNGIKDMVNKMDKVGSSTARVTDKLLAAGASTDKTVKKILRASGSIDKTSDKLKKSSENAKKATASLEKAGKAIDNVNSKAEKAKKSSEALGKIFGKVFNLNNMKKGMKLIDDMAQTNTKLGSITNNKQERSELKNKIFASSGNSRGSFANMADTVVKLRSTTGDTFKNNDETIAFTELAQRSFVSGGLSKEGRTTAMGQLTDSMAGGGIKGDALTSLTKTAPAIVEAISNYTGASGKDLKALADQGQITAEVMKNAMFAASDEINNNFAAAPMTFEDIWSRIKDTGIQAFSGIMEKITEFISTPGFSQFIAGLSMGIGMLVEGITWLIGVFQSGWSIIGPILAIIGSVLLIQMIAGLWAMIPPIILQAIQWFIAALPLLIFIGLIAALIVMAINMGATFRDVIGFIGSIVGGLVTVFNNIFVYIWNIVADVVNFIANAFDNAALNVKIALKDMAIFGLDILEGLILGIEEMINRIPGVKIDISSGISDYKNKLMAETDKLKSEKEFKTYVERKQYKSVIEGADAGKNFATETYDKGVKFLNSLPDTTLPTGPSIPFTGNSDPSGGIPADTMQYPNPTNPLPIEGSGPNGSVNVEMPDDDLDYLRDIAERDYIANVATNSLAPNISVQFGDVHENADADKVAGRIREILQNEIAVASEGGY